MKKTDKHPLLILLQNRNELISSFLKGKEPDFLNQHAQILNDYFIDIFRKSPMCPVSNKSCAIIAVGGYGRKEQCIHSDVDLLMLFGKKVSKEADDLVRKIIYPLWDIGLDVGYAARSIKESLYIAGKDIEVLTSILDARFICGNSNLFLDLIKQMREKVILKESDKIIRSIVENNVNRHKRFGDSTYLLEPNLKVGRGGLRDYHTMLWIARILSNISRPRDLEFYGYLSYEEFRTLTKSLSFIWNVRNRLHNLTGRKCDQLHFEYQTDLAYALKYNAKNGQQPVERFLGDLHSNMEFIKQLHMMFLYEYGYTNRYQPDTKQIKHTGIDGFEIIKDRLSFSSPEKILQSPDLLIKIFEESAVLKVPLGYEAKRFVKEFAYLVDDKYRASPSAVKSFEKILITLAPTFNVLNEMFNTGFLVHFIPELKAIVNRIQYNEYHIYPVDKHLLRTVQIIKNFGTSEDTSKDRLYGDLYNKLTNTNRKILLWAALLHDIGKKDPAKNHSQKGAEIARSILVRHGYKSEEVETVSFLIKEHLSLIKTATRRDINVEETSISFARKVKDKERLKMLYLLTIADSMATGPKAWSAWTSTLLKDLFLKVLHILEKGELATKEAANTVKKKKEEILRSISLSNDRQTTETLFNFMSPRYLLYTTTQDILEHISLYKSLGNADFVWKITKVSDSNTRTVTICAKDRPGLISKIAGIFTLHNLDILDTQVYTWRNNIALDIFKVNPPLDKMFEEEKWNKTEKDLKSALSGKLNLTKALDKKISAYQTAKPYTLERPHRIVVDNKSSSFFTIIEVFTYDFPGLLFKITDALFRCNLDIRIAKIATKIDQVVDVFYVRDFEGQKVDSKEQANKIKETIEQVLTVYGSRLN